MESKSMTAWISAFSRAYHFQNNSVRIFSDSLAKLLFTDDEYRQISQTMSDGIGFFNPSFCGNREEALRWIVDHQLSPSPLGRAAFAEKALETAVRIGARQYCILGAGYDTFSCRQPDWACALSIFELDRPAAIRDKQARLAAAGLSIPDNVHFLEADFAAGGWQSILCEDEYFSSGKRTFCSLLGLTYYLPQNAFEQLTAALGAILPEGSALAFDYPERTGHSDGESSASQKQVLLAGEAGEAMTAAYSCQEMEHLLARAGFLIYEHLCPEEITAQYFSAYNAANPLHPMAAFEHVNYCLAVKK